MNVVVEAHVIEGHGDLADAAPDGGQRAALARFPPSVGTAGVPGRGIDEDDARGRVRQILHGRVAAEQLPVVLVRADIEDECGISRGRCRSLRRERRYHQHEHR